MKIPVSGTITGSDFSFQWSLQPRAFNTRKELKGFPYIVIECDFHQNLSTVYKIFETCKWIAENFVFLPDNENLAVQEPDSRSFILKSKKGDHENSLVELLKHINPPVDSNHRKKNLVKWLGLNS